MNAWTNDFDELQKALLMLDLMPRDRAAVEVGLATDLRRIAVSYTNELNAIRWEDLPQDNPSTSRSAAEETPTLL